MSDHPYGLCVETEFGAHLQQHGLRSLFVEIVN